MTTVDLMAALILTLACMLALLSLAISALTFVRIWQADGRIHLPFVCVGRDTGGRIRVWRTRRIRSRG